MSNLKVSPPDDERIAAAELASSMVSRCDALNGMIPLWQAWAIAEGFHTGSNYNLESIKRYLSEAVHFHNAIARDESETDGNRLIASIEAKAIEKVLLGITKGKHRKTT